MRYVTLGKTDLQSSVIGLGCMGMSEFYGPADEEESVLTLERALELGVTMFDTSNVYGRGHNEELLGRVLRGRRDKALISTKFGVVRDPDGPSGSTYDRGIDNSPAYMRECLEQSLKRLQTDYVDLYYIHRLDPNADLEEVIGALGDMVKAGKIRAIGLSEVDAQTLQRAYAVHPITALQSEYSLWFRDAETSVLPSCRELGVSFVPYSPLGRGFLTGAIQQAASLAQNDLRLQSPRFQDANLGHNLLLLEQVRQLAARHNCTLGQIALAWICHQPGNMIPIPGTKRRCYLEENVGSLSVQLSAEELRQLDAALKPDAIAGSRHWTPEAAPMAKG